VRSVTLTISWVILLFYVWFFVLFPVPAFVVARRLDVRNAWVAFIPLVGPAIVLLWSIDRTGWMCLLAYIPFVGIGFWIWLVFVVPHAHGRPRWWALTFLIPVVNLAGFWVYAFTLHRRNSLSQPIPVAV
jgi:uncharacterized membrane protein YhaH (DUF805 family)